MRGLSADNKMTSVSLSVVKSAEHLVIAAQNIPHRLNKIDLWVSLREVNEITVGESKSKITAVERENNNESARVTKVTRAILRWHW